MASKRLIRTSGLPFEVLIPQVITDRLSQAIFRNDIEQGERLPNSKEDIHQNHLPIEAPPLHLLCRSLQLQGNERQGEDSSEYPAHQFSHSRLYRFPSSVPSF